jgi:hypothetical protein
VYGVLMALLLEAVVVIAAFSATSFSTAEALVVILLVNIGAGLIIFLDRRQRRKRN